VLYHGGATIRRTKERGACKGFFWKRQLSGSLWLIFPIARTKVNCNEPFWDERVEKYGDRSLNCASAYHCYGKSLLALARSEIDILGGIMKKDLKKKLGNQLGIIVMFQP
jgi:hypothetical protein